MKLKMKWNNIDTKKLPDITFNVELFLELIKEKRLTRKDIATMTGFLNKFLGEPLLIEERLQKKIEKLEKEKKDLLGANEDLKNRCRAFELSFNICVDKFLNNGEK